MISGRGKKKPNGFKFLRNNLFVVKNKSTKCCSFIGAPRVFFLSCYWLDRCVSTGWNVRWGKERNAVHRQGELNLFTIWVISWNLQLQTGKKNPNNSWGNKTGARKVAERKGDLGKSLLSDQRLRLEKQILFTWCEVRFKKNNNKQSKRIQSYFTSRTIFFFSATSAQIKSDRDEKWHRRGVTC